MSNLKKKVEFSSDQGKTRCTEGISLIAKNALLFFTFAYILWSAYELSSLKREITDLTLLLHSKEANNVLTQIQERAAIGNHEFFNGIYGIGDDASTLTMDARIKRSLSKSNNTKKIRGKKRRGKLRKRKRRRCRVCPAGPQGPPGPPGQPGPKAMSKAVHYQSTPPKVQGCISLRNSKAVYCSQNNTFWSSSKYEIIPYFEKAEWTGETPFSSPLRQTESGGFKALHNGLYFLYVQIEKFTKDPREYVGVYVADHRIFHCADSVDKVEISPISPFFNSKEKTCSISGLYYLKRGDIVYVKVISADTAIIISPDKTYFGAILFS